LYFKLNVYNELCCALISLEHSLWRTSARVGDLARQQTDWGKKKGGREEEKEEDDDRRAKTQVFWCPFCLDSENILS
jgi:hypothetical protein